MNQRELRERIAALPPISPDDRSGWAQHRMNIRRHALNEPAQEFLRWSTIQATMFVGDAPATSLEIKELSANGDWPRVQRAIEETVFGGATRLKALPATSGNMVRHALYLRRWEKWTGRKIADVNSILEFGGGYGAMCRLTSNLGFRGKYTSYDFPEMLLLQEYYLSNVGVECEIEYRPVGRYPDTGIPYDLLVGICSISEALPEERDLFLARARVDSYLIVFQERWDGINNYNFYVGWASPGRWRLTQHPYMPSHWCLVGSFDLERRAG